MAYFGKNVRKIKAKKQFNPFISIILPTFNEETMIERRIRNLLEQNYPKEKFEILIVDSASDDKTVSIASSTMNLDADHNPRIMVISQAERKGKADAVNHALSFASGEIIVISDTNSLYNRDALPALVQPFQDPMTGGVSGRYSLMGVEGKYEASESFYWELEHIMLEGESALDSVATVIGTIMAWRKENLVFCPHCLADDFELAIRTRKNGFRILYVPEARACEPGASSFSDQLLQRRRTSAGTIQSLIMHVRFFLPPKGLFFSLILPSHKFLPMISPFIFLSLILCLFFINLHIAFFLTFATYIMVCCCFLFYLSTFMKQTPQKRMTFVKMKNIAYYFVLNEYAILLGWKDIVFRNTSVRWVKAESTRK